MNICRSKDGHVKLWYKINDSDISQDNNAYVVFVRMLFFAHYESNFASIRFNGKQYKLQAGEFSASLGELSAMVHIPTSTLRRVLDRLETDKRISRRTDRQTTIFSICNWSDYQGDQRGKKTNGRANDRANDVANDMANDVANVTEGQKNIKKIKKIKTNSEDRDVLGILNRVTGRNFSVEPKGIAETKKKFTDEQIEQALKNMYKEDWHKPMMSKLKPDYLLRATTIDAFKDYVRPDSTYVLPGSTPKAEQQFSAQMDAALKMTAKERLALEYGL